MKTKQWGLAAVGALWTGVATTAAMLVYAFHEYLSNSSVVVSDLLREDAWHVLALTAVAYVVLWAAFRCVVLRPVQEIDEHLYRIGTGRLQPLALRSHVRELQAIAGGINLMVGRMELDLDTHAIDRLQDELDKLRKLAHGLPELCEDEASELLHCAAALQSAFSELFQTASIQPSLEPSTAQRV